MTFTPVPINLKDAGGTTQPMGSYNDGTNNWLGHCVVDNTGTLIGPATSANQATANTTLSSILTAVSASLPAGTAIIGKVATDQTSHGVTDLVAADITKVAGSAFALGQQLAAASLPVVLTAAQLSTISAPVLGAGTNSVGTVGLNAGTNTIGTVGLNAGSNTIGSVGLVAGSAKVGIFTTDQTTHGTTDLIAADITKVAGNAILTGHGTASGAVRVELPTDGTGQVALAAGTNSIGAVTMVDGGSVTLGSKADAAVTTPGSAGSLIALVKGVLTGINSLVTGTVLAAGTAIVGKVGIDQTTPGTTNGVQVIASLPAGSNTIGAVSSNITLASSAGFTRPANTTAYAAGQLVANSTTAATVNAAIPTISVARANGTGGFLTQIQLQKNSASLTNAIFHVHFFNQQPTVVNGDGATWLPGMPGYIGHITVTMDRSFNNAASTAPGASGLGVPTVGSGISFTPASGAQILYYLIEAGAAYTPVSGEAFNLNAWVN